MPKITPFLWFDDKAEEAMNFYVSIFKHSKVGTITRYGEAGPGLKGTVMSATFQLDGQDFFALNGGPMFKFTEAISLSLTVKRSKKSMNSGTSSRQVAKYKDAAGSGISMVCPGKLFPLSYSRCWETKMLRKQKGS